MVGIDGRLLAEAFQIMAILVHGLYNGQHFFVVDLVVLLCIIELSTKEHNRVEDSVVPHL